MEYLYRRALGAPQKNLEPSDRTRTDALRIPSSPEISHIPPSPLSLQTLFKSRHTAGYRHSIVTTFAGVEILFSTTVRGLEVRNRP